VAWLISPVVKAVVLLVVVVEARWLARACLTHTSTISSHLLWHLWVLIISSLGSLHLRECLVLLHVKHLVMLFEVVFDRLLHRRHRAIVLKDNLRVLARLAAIEMVGGLVVVSFDH